MGILLAGAAPIFHIASTRADERAKSLRGAVRRRTEQTRGADLHSLGDLADLLAQARSLQWAGMLDEADWAEFGGLAAEHINAHIAAAEAEQTDARARTIAERAGDADDPDIARLAQFREALVDRRREVEVRIQESTDAMRVIVDRGHEDFKRGKRDAARIEAAGFFAEHDIDDN